MNPWSHDSPSRVCLTQTVPTHARIRAACHTPTWLEATRVQVDGAAPPSLPTKPSTPCHNRVVKRGHA